MCKIPVTKVSFDITTKCNNRCFYCFAEAGNVKEKEMSLNNFKTMLKKIKTQTRAENIALSGGEPTLHEGFLKFLLEAKKQGFNSFIITNATQFTPDFAKRCFDKGAIGCFVSFHSANKNEHNRQVGSKIAWDETVNGIKAIFESGLKKGSYVNITLTTLNEKSVQDTILFLSNLGVKTVSINPLITAGFGKKVADKKLPVGREIEVMFKAKNFANSIGIEFLNSVSVPFCLHNPQSLSLRTYKCIAGKHFPIDVYGNVKACDFLGDEKLGNLLKQSPKKIWFSEKARHYRNKIYLPERCSSCSSFKMCGGVCPAYLKGGVYESHFF